MKWFAVVGMLLKVVRGLIELSEAIIGPGNGVEKKQAVLDGLAAFLDGLGLETAAVMKWADDVIDIIVSVWNIFGKFKKGTANG